MDIEAVKKLIDRREYLVTRLKAFSQDQSTDAGVSLLKIAFGQLEGSVSVETFDQIQGIVAGSWRNEVREIDHALRQLGITTKETASAI